MRRQHPSRVAGGDPGLEHADEMIAHRALFVGAAGALAQGRGAGGNWRRRTLVWLLRIVAGIVAVPIAYFLAAVILSAVPANVAWRQPEQGITIYRPHQRRPHLDRDAEGERRRWTGGLYAAPAHLRDPRWGNADHVAIGYGNREFYLNTPTWDDLSFGTAARALVGSGTTLLHIEHVDRPRPEEGQRPIRLTLEPVSPPRRLHPAPLPARRGRRGRFRCWGAAITTGTCSTRRRAAIRPCSPATNGPGGRCGPRGCASASGRRSSRASCGGSIDLPSCARQAP